MNLQYVDGGYVVEKELDFRKHLTALKKRQNLAGLPGLQETKYVVDMGFRRGKGRNLPTQH